MRWRARQPIDIGLLKCALETGFLRVAPIDQGRERAGRIEDLLIHHGRRRFVWEIDVDAVNSRKSFQRSADPRNTAGRSRHARNLKTHAREISRRVAGRLARITAATRGQKQTEDGQVSFSKHEKGPFSEGKSGLGGGPSPSHLQVL